MYGKAFHNFPQNAKKAGGRILLSLRNFETSDEAAKVKYIAHGYVNSKKPFLVHQSTSLRMSSTRILLFIAATLQFCIFAHDFTQAYLQSRKPFSRRIYLLPKAEYRSLFQYKENEILNLRRRSTAYHTQEILG